MAFQVLVWQKTGSVYRLHLPGPHDLGPAGKNLGRGQERWAQWGGTISAYRGPKGFPGPEVGAQGQEYGNEVGGEQQGGPNQP